MSKKVQNNTWEGKLDAIMLEYGYEDAVKPVKAYVSSLLTKQKDEYEAELVRLRKYWKDRVERQREQALKAGQLLAYENVLVWTKQCDPENKNALSAHGSAIDQIKYELLESFKQSLDTERKT